MLRKVPLIFITLFSPIIGFGQDCNQNENQAISMIYGMVWGQPDQVDSIFYKNPNFSPEIMQTVLKCGLILSENLTGMPVKGPPDEQLFITIKSLTDNEGVPELADEIINNSKALFNSAMIGQYINELVVMFPELAMGNESEFTESSLYQSASLSLENIKVSNPDLEEEYRRVIYYIQFWYLNYLIVEEGRE